MNKQLINIKDRIEERSKDSRSNYLEKIKFSSEQSKSAIKESKKACEVNCEKSCRLGCYATEGNKNCIYLDDGSMPCCVAKVDNLSKEEFISIVVEKSYSSCKK